MTASVNRVAALAAAFVIAGVGAPVAAAASTPGSEYDVTFSGSASAHIVSSSHSGGDPNVETNSADQSASWKVVDNSPARLWLPTKLSSGAEGLLSTAATQHVPPTAPETGTVTQTGMYTPDTTEVPYSCTASSVYDDGVATASVGVVLGKLSLATSYGSPGRGFNSGGTSVHPNAFTCTPADALPHANLDFSDTIAYGATVPFTSVGQAKISLPASDLSTFPPCPAGINPQDSCTGPNFHLSGAYTLTKVCDGTVSYAGGSVTGKCGASAAPLKLTNAVLGKSKVASRKGFVLKVTLTAAGKVSVKLLRHVTRVSHHRKRHLLVAAGTLTLTGRSGANSFPVGRVGGHRLAPGSYELVVSAGAGKRTLSLTVTR